MWGIIKTFLKNYWVAVIATIALIQPWVMAFWKKYFRKGDLDIYSSGNIEIGYSNLGPTISIQGTLRAINEDIFVKNICLRIKINKNQEEHKFDWIAFRSPHIVGEQRTLELSASFVMSAIQPYRYVIVFADAPTQSEIQTYLQKCSQKFLEIIKEQKISFPGIQPITPSIDEVTIKYRNSESYGVAFENLNRNLYWEKGDYELEIIVNADRPEQSFIHNCKFSLTDENFGTLKLNVITMIEDLLQPYFQKPPLQYLFAYAAYK